MAKLSKSVRYQLAMGLMLAMALLLNACADPTPATSLPPQPNGNLTPNGVLGNLTPAVTQTLANLDCTRIFCFGLAQEPAAFLQQNNVFDPANLLDRPSLQISRQLYETLFEFEPDSMQYRYSSLVRYVTESPDKRTYTIRIRRGVAFSDGTSLTPSAIKFNFERWSETGNIYHQGEFQTYGEYFEGFPGMLEDINADNANSVLTIKLRQPLGSFYQILSLPQFGIVAPSAFNNSTGIMERTVGSGRYYLERVNRTADAKYALLRENPRFYEQRFDPGDPNIPYVKSPSIAAIVLRQSQDGLQEIKQGAIGATDKVRPEQSATAQTDPQIKALQRQPLGTAFLVFNHTRPPFSNLLVRQAFAAAVNLPNLTRDYYYGQGKPASSLLPPSVLGADASLAPYQYDPERARQLLNLAGYNADNPLVLDFYVIPVLRPYYPDPLKVAKAVAADLERVGVKVNVRNDKSWTVFRNERATGSLGFYQLGWQGQNGDPDEFLSALFANPRGEGYYENPQLAQLIRQGREQIDPRERRITYKAVQELIYNELPFLPLAYTGSLVLTRPTLKGYQPHPTGIESWANVGY